jgi:hypothetical protein
VIINEESVAMLEQYPPEKSKKLELREGPADSIPESAEKL